MVHYLYIKDATEISNWFNKCPLVNIKYCASTIYTPSSWNLLHYIIKLYQLWLFHCKIKYIYLLQKHSYIFDRNTLLLFCLRIWFVTYSWHNDPIIYWWLTCDITDQGRHQKYNHTGSHFRFYHNAVDGNDQSLILTPLLFCFCCNESNTREAILWPYSEFWLPATRRSSTVGKYNSECRFVYHTSSVLS